MCSGFPRVQLAEARIVLVHRFISTVSYSTMTTPSRSWLGSEARAWASSLVNR